MSATYDNQMIKIDGGKIRRMREQKGLTQLYLATVIGVTTDTISRWENKRYQTIKKQNADKLAEALETELDNILDKETAAAKDAIAPEHIPPSPDPTTAPTSFLHGSKIPFLVLSAILLIAVSLFYIKTPHPNNTTLRAQRILPDHCPPGVPFPVTLEVDADSSASLSIIVKEMVPTAITPLPLQPPFKITDDADNILKWLQKVVAPTTFLYIGTIDKDTGNEPLIFSGTVTIKGKKPLAIKDSSLSVSTFHWADTNKDRQIDDDEILSVYDTFSDFEGTAINFSLIEDIWSSSGYKWDPLNQQIEVIP